jgi:hypothetical protein
LKIIELIWLYGGNPAPVNLMLCPEAPCAGDKMIVANVKVNLATALKLVGDAAQLLLEVTPSVTTTELAPAVKPGGTRALSLNVPAPETGAVKG